MSQATPITVYYDFLCPWAYRAAIWLEEVDRQGRVRADWRFFSLSDNHRRREGVDQVPIWERDGTAKGLPAFKAAIAARMQGEKASTRFRLALQQLRHADKQPVDDPATHRRAVERAGLDAGRYERDLRAASLQALAAEHEEAVRRGVFGVPTLVWPEGRTYYVKITELVPADRAVRLYDAIEDVHRFGEVIEIKTPESEGTLVG